MLHATDVMPNMTTIIIAVFAFQLAGCAYHPPAGDQTCFGYLRKKKEGKPTEPTAAARANHKMPLDSAIVDLRYLSSA